MKIIFLLLLNFIILNANVDIKLLASKLNLCAGMKAKIQWERIFSSNRHLKRYKLNKLENKIKKRLKIYLISHSADSEQPIVPGL